MNANGDDATIQRPCTASRRVAAARLLAALLALLLGAVATAFSPPLGSDVMVTDASGARFIGVGRVNDQGLVLELTERRSQIRFVVVPPDGEPQSFRGALRDGRLEVEADDGTLTDLETLLGGQERRLVVTWSEDDRDETDDAPRSDRGDPRDDGDHAPPPPDGEDDDEDDDEDREPEGGGDAGERPGDDERPGEGGDPSDDPDEGEDGTEDGDDERDDDGDDGLLPVDPPSPPSDDAPDPPLDAPDVDVDLGLP